MAKNDALAALRPLFPGRGAAENFRSVETALVAYGSSAGLNKPHRLAHYLAQLAHETGGMVYDREVWGPTAAQDRYDIRTDLGNTPERDGDGKKYMGRTGIMLTGKANVTAFRNWCVEQGMNPPDFVANPDLLNTDPWEGLAAIWFWTVGNRTHKSLNVLADANNIEQITKVVNGGLNGFADRVAWYVKISLALLGYSPNDVRSFQKAAKAKGFYDGEIDGDPGPKTRAALHKALAALSGATVAAAPIVEEKPVAVAPAGADKMAITRGAALIGMAAPAASQFVPAGDIAKLIVLGVGILAVGVLLWRGELIASRVKAVLRAVGGAS